MIDELFLKYLKNDFRNSAAVVILYIFSSSVSAHLFFSVQLKGT